VYETKPFGDIQQNNFFNAVIKIETDYKPKELFYFLKNIEVKLGRTKSFKWGPREIDLDLLFYNKEIYSDSELTIPHRGVTERDFVIVPLCDIEPDFMHPVTQKKVSDIDLTKIESNIINKTEYKL
jgi:2-amino-4-hydroxy-6-hydroxymethyldihydropteridine diphosphokinase